METPAFESSTLDRLSLCLPPPSRCACRCASKGWSVLGSEDVTTPSRPPSTEELKAELWREDVGSDRRGAMWKAVLLENVDLESRAEEPYETLCVTPSQYDAGIQRDLARTLPSDPLFRERNGKGQRALFRVLRSIAVRLWDIGYVQSMNFLVATIVGVFPDDEATAFQCAQALLFRHSLADMYRPKFPKMGVTVWQFDRIVEGFLPGVHGVLERDGVTAEYYALQWFMTLFASDLPQATVRRVWDRFLLAGWRIIVQVGLALLADAQETLLSLDSCEALSLLKRCAVRSKRAKDPQALLAAADRFEVSHRMLSELEAAYVSDRMSSARLILQRNLDTGELAWTVERIIERDSSTRGDAEISDFAVAAAALHAGARKPGADGTVLPFLLHNLNTGETTVMDGAWDEYRAGEVQAQAHAPAADRRPTAQELEPEAAEAPPCSGGFYTAAMQQQAMRRLNRA